MQLVCVLITGLLSVLAFCGVLRQNLHMFQLNGYKNGEHINWLKKNGRRQWLLGALLIFGALQLCAGATALYILCWLCLYLIILVFAAMKRLSVKKKLVYTARVKRLIVTDVILSLAAGAGIAAAGGKLPLAFMAMVSLQIIMPVIANVVNSPIEKGINLHYINDAKRCLERAGDITVIGVTGSYGKTSVKFYLKTLLQDHFNVLVTPESYNTPMGVVKTIRGSLKNTHEIFVCEMGARHVGDIKEICDIVHPRHGLITSVGPQHLDTFFNMENIVNTKFELAEALPADGLLFLNGDNEYMAERSKEYPGAILYHGAEDGGNAGGYRAGDIKLSRLGTEFTVTAPDGESERFFMYLVGGHNVVNVVGAIAVANTLGVPLKSLKSSVRKILPVEHRMQLRENGDVTIIDDAYNSNPVGSKAAVETLAMYDGVRILVTPGMVELGEKEEEFNRLFGTYAAACCDYILLVGKKRAVPIMEGVLEKGFDKKKCLVFDKLEEALSYAYAIKDERRKYILLENDLPDNY